MSDGTRRSGILERAKGFEPSTPTLARSCSTTELHPHPCERRNRAADAQTYAKSGGRMQQGCDTENRTIFSCSGLDRSAAREMAQSEPPITAFSRFVASDGSHRVNQLKFGARPPLR
jgi:hypothetical protein